MCTQSRFQSPPRPLLKLSKQRTAPHLTLGGESHAHHVQKTPTLRLICFFV